MPNHTNLVRRGATYYFRARVPEDLKHHYRRREFFISLKTTCRFQAEHALVVLKSRLFQDFLALRGKAPEFRTPSLPFPVESKVETERTSLWSLVDYWQKQAERRPRTLMEVNTTFKRLIQCNGQISVEELAKSHVC